MTVPLHGVVFPVIAFGCAGAAEDVGVTAKSLGVEETPQELFATTLTVPAVVVGVTEILFVVEVPDQPPGKVHVYEAAPATAFVL